MATKSDDKRTNKEDENPQEVIKKRSDLYEFRAGLVKAPKKGAKFQYAVSRNLRRVNPEIEDMEKAIEQTPAMKQYQKMVDELNKKHTDKDEFGKYQTFPRIVQGDKIDIYAVKGKDVDGSAYEKELAGIKKKKHEAVKPNPMEGKKEEVVDEEIGKTYQEVIDAHDKKVEEYNEFLKEPCSWDPYMINLTDCPDEAGTVIGQIIYMIRNINEL